MLPNDGPPASGRRTEDLAALLDAADRDRRPLPRPQHWVGTTEEAYAVQRDAVALRSARLRSPRVGYKVALTSAAAQSALFCDRPAAGELLAADVRPCAASVPVSSVFSPLVEVEVVFRLRRDLEPGAAVDDVVAGADVVAGLECPDSRYADWFGGSYPALPLQAVVSDDCLAGLLVLGQIWLPADSLDLSQVTAVLWVGDEVVAEGDAGNVLDHPASAVVWLNDHLAGQGIPLRAGTLVSSGTLTPPVVFPQGTVRAELSAGLGAVWATLA